MQDHNGQITHELNNNYNRNIRQNNGNFEVKDNYLICLSRLSQIQKNVESYLKNDITGHRLDDHMTYLIKLPFVQFDW